MYHNDIRFEAGLGDAVCEHCGVNRIQIIIDESRSTHRVIYQREFARLQSYTVGSKDYHKRERMKGCYECCTAWMRRTDFPSQFFRTDEIIKIDSHLKPEVYDPTTVQEEWLQREEDFRMKKNMEELDRLLDCDMFADL